MNSQLPRILIAEDDKLMRMKLRRILEKELGVEVLAAEDGEQAWQMFLAAEDIQFIISDWMMPICDGPELCARVRGAENRLSTYFILTTARSEQEDLLEGLASGADDYISKPINSQELLARVNAGMRVVRLERSLADIISELETALEAASQVQRGMLPGRQLISQVLETCGLNVAFRYQSCDDLGGDILGMSLPEPGVLSIFLGDVSGHGVAASLSAVSLHSYLQTCMRDNHDPVEVVKLANDYCLTEFPPGTYSTLVYLRVLVKERTAEVLIAGHPPLIHLRQDGTVATYPAAVPPVGLFPDAPVASDVVTIDINSGERLVAYTDGVIESRNEAGEFYSEAHLEEVVRQTADVPVEELPDRVLADVTKWLGHGGTADDDVTFLAIQFNDRG